MKLSERDKAITRIGHEIEHQKALMRKRFAGLKTTANENRLLSRVVDDYQRYYDHLRKQKEEQKEALRLVSEYLTDVAATSDLTKALLQEAKHDQTATLEEIEHIRKDIDSLLAPEVEETQRAATAPPEMRFNLGI